MSANIGGTVIYIVIFSNQHSGPVIVPLAIDQGNARLDPMDHFTDVIKYLTAIIRILKWCDEIILIQIHSLENNFKRLQIDLLEHFTDCA